MAKVQLITTMPYNEIKQVFPRELGDTGRKSQCKRMPGNERECPFGKHEHAYYSLPDLDSGRIYRDVFDMDAQTAELGDTMETN